MKNIRLLSFLLIIFISGNEVYCQKIFRDGYIIKKGGEPIYGLIGYSSGQGIPSKCIFKRFDIASEIQYGPEEISAFGYKNGNRYESIELNHRKIFYEVLVTGEIVLYKKGSSFYIDKDHTGIIELKKGPVSISVSGKEYHFKTLPEFLNYITESKMGVIIDEFNIKNDITPLIASFNKMSGNSYSILNRTMTEKQLSQKAFETGTKKSRFGFISGINFYMLNLNQSPDNFFPLPEPEMENGIVYGLTYERLLSRKTDKFSLKVELLYGQQTFYSYEENIHGNIYTDRSDFNFEFTGIKMPVLFQYSFTGARIVPYINAGFAYQFILNQDYLQTKEREYLPLKEVTTSEYRNMELRSGEISGLGGLGLRTRIFNNLSIHFQARAEIGSGILVRIKEDGSYYEGDPFDQKSLQTTFLLGITF